MIRRQIYLRELKYLENNFKPKDWIEIINILFDVDWSKPQNIYLLSPNIQSQQDIEAKLEDYNNINLVHDLFSFNEEDLKLPNEIVRKFKEKEKFALFVGAGVSKLAGMPLWSELSENAIKYLANKNNYSYSQLESIKRNFKDPRQILTFVETNLKKEDRHYFYNDQFKISETKDPNPYIHLLNFASINVTTNIDNLYWEAINTNNIDIGKSNFDRPDIKFEKIAIPKVSNNQIPSIIKNINSNSVYYLHGNIEDSSNLIMTSPQYINAYYKEESPIRVFLKHIFHNYNIIFVGTSLQELVILEMLLNPKDIDKQLKRWALIECYENELSEFHFHQDALDAFGIKPIPYFRDLKDHSRLRDVLESWSIEIQNIKSQSPIYDYSELDDLMENPTANFDKIHTIISLNEKLLLYFFRKLQNPKIILKLYHNGYLEPEKLTFVFDANNDKKPATDFPILDYTYRMLPILYENNIYNEELKKVIVLIETLCLNHQNNPHLIFWLSKIITELKVNDISIEILNSINNWLVYKNTINSISSSICYDLLTKLCHEDYSKAEILLKSIINITSTKKDDSEFFPNKHTFLFEKYWVKEGLDKNLSKIAVNNLSSTIQIIVSTIIKSIYFDIGNKSISKEYNGFTCTLQIPDQGPESKQLNLTVEKDNVIVYQQAFSIKTTRSEIIFKIKKVLSTSSNYKEKEIKDICENFVRIYCSLVSEHCWSAINDKSYFDTSDDAIPILIGFLRDLLKSCNDKTLLNSSITQLLEEELLIFTKIGLHTIANHSIDLKQHFWDLLEGRNSDVIFEELYFGSELNDVLIKLVPLISEKRQKLEAKIESGSILWSDDFPDNPKYINYWKQKRYNSLKKDPYFETVYLKYKVITKRDAELNAGVSPIEVTWGSSEPSPLSKEQIFDMKIKDLVNYINQFVESGHYKKPSYESFSRTIESCIVEKPEHFLPELNEFKNVGYLWVSKILDGLKEHVIKNPESYLNILIKFVNEYANQSIFWSDDLQVIKIDGIFRYSHKSVIDSVCRIIYELSNRDNFEFEEYSGEIHKILCLFLSRFKLTNKIENDYGYDYVNYAINTSEGKIAEALLQFQLARIQSTKDQVSRNNLSTQINNDALALFERDNPSFLIILGMYLPFLFHHDKNFYQSSINKLNDDNSLIYLTAGYIHSHRFIDELYPYLTKGLKLIIEDTNTTKADLNTAIEYATLAFLRGLEDINKKDSMIKNLTKIDFDHLCSITNFVSQVSIEFSYNNQNPNPKEINKFQINTKKYWIFLLNKLEKKNCKFDKYQKSRLAELMLDFSYYYPMEEDIQKLVLKTIEVGLLEVHYLKNFYDYLLKNLSFSDKLNFIGEIFVKLSEKHKPYFLDDSLISIVKILNSNASTKPFAEEAAANYIKNGHYQIVDILKENKT